MTDVVSLKLATRKCYYMPFTLLTTLANQHPPIIVWNRNKPLYCNVPDSLSESLARARLEEYRLCMEESTKALDVILGGVR